jgi:hypothetical protein
VGGVAGVEVSMRSAPPREFLSYIQQWDIEIDSMYFFCIRKIMKVWVYLLKRDWLIDFRNGHDWSSLSSTHCNATSNLNKKFTVASYSY